MRLVACCMLAVLLLAVLEPAQAQAWKRPIEAVRGAREMYRAYRDMKQANWRNSDRYFHARGNRDAAKHGPGGRWAAEKISNLREIVDQRIKGDSRADSLRDQAANRWGRNGGDPNKYRPRGLPSKY